MAKNKILWITDPWLTLDHPRDTTLRFTQAAEKLDIQQNWCDVKSIRLEGNQVVLDSKPILSIGPERMASSFQFGPVKTSTFSDFTQVHYRTDPPVDSAYLHPLQLIALGVRGLKKCEIVNPLEVLLIQNEKFEAAALGDLMPPSLVSSSWEQFLKFGKAQRRTVLKPLHEAQSHGIELLDWRNPEGIKNAQQLLMQTTQNFNTPIILQQYLEGIQAGETRLWYLDGSLLACAKKHPVSGDFRVNMDRGSQLSPAQLTSREKKISLKISKHLKSRRIRLAAVDLIEDFITDFNFTSPGLIPQMEVLLGKELAPVILKKLKANFN